jgi:Arc/MetJ-type ribon-helix-helix transcriptional regulator
MNVRLTLHSEQLIREELARGKYHSPEELIERALESLSDRERITRVADLDEFDAALDALAEGSETLPDLPDEAFTRQSIYQGHD